MARLALILLTLIMPLVASAEEKVSVERDGCTLSLSYFTEGINVGGLQFRSTCALKPEAVEAVFTELIGKLPPGIRAKSDSLFIGELGDVSKEYRTRLSVTALGDKGWDKKKGKPVKGDYNSYVSALVPGVLPEVTRALGAHKITVTRASCEKVIALPVERMAGKESMKAAGAGDKDKLPMDALIYLKLGH